MGVSSTARLPSLGAQSIPPLFSHLQHTSNAKVVARWSITIRSFRAVPVPTNAWPAFDQFDSSFLPQSSSAADLTAVPSAHAGSSSGVPGQAGALGAASTAGTGSGSSTSGAPPLTKPRTMWQVWLSDHPGVVFVIVEDTGKASRAKVWRDWEVLTKKWKKEKRREIEARKRKLEKAEQAAKSTQAQTQNSAAVEETTVDTSKEASEDKPADPIENVEASHNQAEAMDVDAITTAEIPSSAQPQPEPAAAADTSKPHGATTEGPPIEGGASTSKEPTEPTEATEEVAEADEENIEEAGPKPKLRLPSHTRYTVSALTSSMSAMLTGLNLPPPHGAPVGTAGPGAWVPRGAAVSIEGLVLEINSQSLNALPGISPALASVSSMDDAVQFSRSNGKASSGVEESGTVDWRVRVGSVMGGGGRSAGAIVEAEFLPVSTLLPTSKFMHDFLHSLFPPGLVPMPPPAPASSLPNTAQLRGAGAASRTASATGTPQASHTTFAQAPGINGSNAAVDPAGGASAFSYAIGGGATAPPNRNFNIPVVSDQLWEEVVPRSGEGWRRRIAKRSHQMRLAARVQRRQRRDAAASTSAENSDKGKITAGEPNGDDAFGWHTFGSDDETPASAHANGDWQDDEEEISSSDSEAEKPLAGGASTSATGLTGTAVTMQQVDEDDDDDDDDRPLGAPAWLNASRTSSVPTPTNAPSTTAPAEIAAKKEETVQLIFQGLRQDVVEMESSTDSDGWTGIERGRRIAFQYVQMLRAEGII